MADHSPVQQQQQRRRPAAAAAAAASGGTLHPLGNVGELASPPSSGADHELLPENPKPVHPEGVLRLPVFDMSKFSGHSGDDLREREAVALGVREACREWGLFQVVNHGVPPDAIRKVKELGLGFFALPTEQKEKAAMGKRRGYEARSLDMKTKGAWVESLTIGVHPDHKVAEIANRVWLEPNHEFVDGITQYSSCVAGFSQTLWILLAESLGLEPNTFSRHSQDHGASFRFSFYPPCPDPSLTFGVGPHTDPNLVTILYQDEVGGLEIHDEHRGWIGVEPRAGALVIFVGDALQAWTNDLYQSVEHRVVVNPDRARISVAFFVVPSKTAVIHPIEKWIDEAHPLKYKSFNWGDFEEWVKEVAMTGEKATFQRSWLSKIVVK